MMNEITNRPRERKGFCFENYVPMARRDAKRRKATKNMSQPGEQLTRACLGMAQMMKRKKSITMYETNTEIRHRTVYIRRVSQQTQLNGKSIGNRWRRVEKLIVYAECQVAWTKSERKGDSNIAQPLFGLCCVRLRIYFRIGHVFALPLRCQTFSSHLRNKIFMQIGMKTSENSVFSSQTHAKGFFSGLLMFW